MATPSPLALASWEQAFELHPLPVVRNISKQLRSQIDDNQSKLRSLVGASYRDLLSTAETIIDMNAQLQTVELQLGNVGAKCNARAIERINVNYANLHAEESTVKHDRLSLLASTKLLQSTLAIAGRTMKAKGDALLVAKLLILGRLLCHSIEQKIVSHDPTGVRDILETLQRRLTNLRKRALAFIDRGLASVMQITPMAGVNNEPPLSRSTKRDINTLCAYALLTSSTSKNTLRHFLSIRYNALSEQPSTTSLDVTHSSLERITLFRSTLASAQTLFSSRFSSALSLLSKTPLLQDPQIRRLDALSLDMHEYWIGAEIKTFTPWVQHEPLASSDLAAALSAWNQQAQRFIIEHVAEALAGEHDAKNVLEMRKVVLSQYLALLDSDSSSSSNSRADKDPLALMRELHPLFTKRMKELVEQQAVLPDLSIGSSPSTTTLEHPYEQVSSNGLWALALSPDLDLSHGARSFRKEILQRHHGHDQSLQAVTTRLETWQQQLAALWIVAEQMRATKWVIDIDLEDDEEADELQKQLSRADPEGVESTLQSATAKAFDMADEGVGLQARQETAEPAQLLRVLRELAQSRQKLGDRVAASVTNDASTSGDGLAQQLNRRLATTVSTESLEEYHSARLHHQQQQPTSAATIMALWDSGDPPLPVQLSPPVFRFASGLQRRMAAAGTDLWNTSAVAELKGVISDALVTAMKSEVEESEGVTEVSEETSDAVRSQDGPDGEDGGEEGTGAEHARAGSHALKLQTLFDLLYLQRVLTTASYTEGQEASLPLKTLCNSTAEALGVADDAGIMRRLAKSAEEYWGRTYLLFGLLAGKDSM